MLLGQLYEFISINFREFISIVFSGKKTLEYFFDLWRGTRSIHCFIYKISPFRRSYVVVNIESKLNQSESNTNIIHRFSSNLDLLFFCIYLLFFCIYLLFFCIYLLFFLIDISFIIDCWITLWIDEFSIDTLLCIWREFEIGEL